MVRRGVHAQARGAVLLWHVCVQAGEGQRAGAGRRQARVARAGEARQENKGWGWPARQRKKEERRGEKKRGKEKKEKKRGKKEEREKKKEIGRERDRGGGRARV